MHFRTVVILFQSISNSVVWMQCCVGTNFTWFGLVWLKFSWNHSKTLRTLCGGLYVKHLNALQEVNNINDQLDATITILLIFVSAQHISGNLLPIFRSVRLIYSCVVCCSNVVVGWRSRVRRPRLCVWCEGCCSSNIPHTEHSLRSHMPDLQPTTTLGQHTTLL
jgi:hypothetical protein